MSFDEQWEGASADGPSNSEPPEEGSYLVALIDAGAFTAKSTGDDYAKLGFRDTDGGHEWDVLLGFKNQKQASVAKGQCSTIGVDVDEVTTLDELDDALKQHVGKFYDVTVKRNGKFVNTYVEGEATATPTTDVPADAPEPEPVAAGGAADDDDSIPFARPRIPDRETRRRDLFAGDKFTG